MTDNRSLSEKNSAGARGSGGVCRQEKIFHARVVATKSPRQGTCADFKKQKKAARF